MLSLGGPSVVAGDMKTYIKVVYHIFPKETIRIADQTLVFDRGFFYHDGKGTAASLSLCGSP